jgi:hypothetical protein
MIEIVKFSGAPLPNYMNSFAACRIDPDEPEKILYYMRGVSVAEMRKQRNLTLSQVKIGIVNEIGQVELIEKGDKLKLYPQENRCEILKIKP